MRRSGRGKRVKIAFIGSGSLVFTQKFITDILSYPALSDCELALMDIDPKRLDYSRRVAERIVGEGRCKALVKATSVRKDALAGARYVFTTILPDGVKAFRPEIEIPMKYGLDQAVGDTTGVGGVFRALRTIPAMLDIMGDVERYASPGALVLNYTNPMHMLSWAVSDAFPRLPYVGLCHNVPNTVEILARALEVPSNDVSHWIAGINHQAWVLEFSHKGRSLIEDIRRKADTPEFYREEPVRCEMCRTLGYFVTESSPHNSEYTPWFRKTPEIAATFTPGGSSDHALVLKEYERTAQHWEERLEGLASGSIPLDLTRSHEYAGGIINALETGEMFRFSGNVRNTGLITNLPSGCSVEVPCIADHLGIKPLHVGELPPQLAALNRMNVSVHELAVLAAREKDSETILQAIALDPLTSAVLTPPRIRHMVSELLDAQSRYLPGFERLRARTEMKLPAAVLAGSKAETFKKFNVIPTFHVIGPFGNTDNDGKCLELSQVLPPEQGVDLSTNYPGKGGKNVAWKRVTSEDMEEDGFVDLNRLLGQSVWAVGYAYAVLEAMADTMAVLQVGSDDGVAVWLNGIRMYAYETQRGAHRAQAEVPLHLRDGRNELLLKVDQKRGGWGFYANFAEPVSGVTVRAK